MNKNNIVLLVSMLVFGMVSITSTSFAKEDVTEKCMGLAKAGMGDGKVTVDDKVEEWLYVPVGSCSKFVGGRIYIEKK